MCDYCQGKRALIESPAAGVSIIGCQMKMVSYYGTEDTVLENIKYCPMCMNKLENRNPSLDMVYVEVAMPFYMGKYVITRKEWFDLYPEKNDGKGKLYRPITNISWYDAINYCNDRSIEEGLMTCYTRSGSNYMCNFKANGYRLPTEAEWEYAARGGQKGINDNFEYAGSNNIDEVAWYNKNSKGRVHRVGKKKPNQLGLYDMSGNVYEWCWTEISSGSSCVNRGGSWGHGPAYARVANRYYDSPGDRYYAIGFRVVRTA